MDREARGHPPAPLPPPRGFFFPELNLSRETVRLEQVRANSKKTQRDASANVFPITLEKKSKFLNKSVKIIITTQTNYLEATAKRN